MLQKSDGASTYAARDCAEAIDRWEKYRFGANIYVVSRQEDHFAQVFAALGKLAVAEQLAGELARALRERELRLRAGHVHPQGRGRVARGRAGRGPGPGRPLPGGARRRQCAGACRSCPPRSWRRSASRVGQAALLYFDVSSRRLTDVTFDWDTVLQFEGNTGPYLQYTHARMSGIFRKAAEAGLATPDSAGRPAAAGGRRGVGAGAEAARLQPRRSGGPRNSASPSRWPTTCTSSPACSTPSTTGTSCWTRPTPPAAGPGWRSWAARARCWRAASRLLGIRPLEYM